jgi:hypothetical protein
MQAYNKKSLTNWFILQRKHLDLDNISAWPRTWITHGNQGPQAHMSHTCSHKTINAHRHPTYSQTCTQASHLLHTIARSTRSNPNQRSQPEIPTNRVKGPCHSWPWARLSWQFTLCRCCTTLPTGCWFHHPSVTKSLYFAHHTLP